jgi:hypothetical protein
MITYIRSGFEGSQKAKKNQEFVRQPLTCTRLLGETTLEAFVQNRLK